MQLTGKMSDITRVKHYFTRSASGFDSLYWDEGTTSIMRSVNQKFRRDLYERFRLSLEHVGKYKPRTVLDVGCGSGRYEPGLAQLGVQTVVGIDVSPGMIQLAKGLNAKLAASSCQLNFVNEDFMNFQVNEAFDVVMAMGLFDYVRSPIPVLQRMAAFARHSVIASFPSISWYRTPIRKVRYFLKQCPVYFYRRSEIDSLGRTAGFARTEILKIEGAGQDYFVSLFK